MNFLVQVAGYSEGGVLTDPSLPVTDIEAKIDALGFGYGRTFGMFGHSANFAIAAAISSRSTPPAISAKSGLRSTREGVGDAKIRLAMNLIGGPPMTPREFAQREPKTTLGFSPP